MVHIRLGFEPQIEAVKLSISLLQLIISICVKEIDQGCVAGAIHPVFYCFE